MLELLGCEGTLLVYEILATTQKGTFRIFELVEMIQISKSNPRESVVIM